jgi:hypothetical protein
MKQPNGHCQSDLPEIVFTVIIQTARLRCEGAIPPETLHEKLRRLEREELDRRGLQLLVRELPEGRLRFLIKARQGGDVREMIEYPAAEDSGDASHGNDDGAHTNGIEHSHAARPQGTY